MDHIPDSQFERLDRQLQIYGFVVLFFYILYVNNMNSKQSVSQFSSARILISGISGAGAEIGIIPYLSIHAALS